jgi:SAM-dependent methyltransferase
VQRESCSAFDDPAACVPMTPRHHEFYRGRNWSWYEPYAQHFTNCERVLDLGSGPGLMLEALQHVGVRDAVGLERDPIFLARSWARALNVIDHDLNWPFPFLATESFDGVFSFQVFDYLTDLAKRVTLQEAWRVLRPGGVIHIHSQSRFNERAGQDAARVGRTTPNELAAMLRDAGFEDISLAGNTLMEVPGRDPEEIRREWLLDPRDEISLTANASARKPHGEPRATPEGGHSVLELWHGVEAKPAFSRYTVAPWRRSSASPILSPGTSQWNSLSVRDGTLVTTPTKESVRPHGRLVMFFTAYGGSPSDVTRSIGRAESDDGVRWVRQPDRPVLEAGVPGDWDDGGAAAGSVVRIEADRYLMYYSGRNRDGRFIGIGLAESEDTVRWRKLPGNPILSVDDYADLRHLVLADVFRAESGIWVMHAEGWHVPEDGFRVYQARGDGPDAFRPEGNGSWVLGVVPGTWESHHVANPKCVEVEPSRFLLAYNGATKARDFQVGLAVSEDLLNWDRYWPCPVLSRSHPLCSDGFRVESGFMLAEEIRAGTPRMWYFGSDTRTVTVGCHILLAESKPRLRTPDWQRWATSRISLYEIGPEGLRVLPGATRPEHALRTELGGPEESLVSFAVRPEVEAPGGSCALGWGDGKPWLTIDTNASIRWGNEPVEKIETVGNAEEQPLAFCVRLKCPASGSLKAELTAWHSKRLSYRAERELPPAEGPLSFRCAAAPEGAVWLLDHLLLLTAHKKAEADRAP